MKTTRHKHTGRPDIAEAKASLKSLGGINAIAAWLHDYGQDLANDYDPQDIADDDGNPCGDVRLQYDSGLWNLHTGDAQYDTDHTGRWGESSVDASESLRQCRETAADLVDQVLDDITCNPEPPDIQDDDLRLDHIPDVKECRALLATFKANGFSPNVWHVNERGNVDLLAIGRNGATIVQSWV